MVTASPTPRGAGAHAVYPVGWERARGGTCGPWPVTPSTGTPAQGPASAAAVVGPGHRARGSRASAWENAGGWEEENELLFSFVGKKVRAFLKPLIDPLYRVYRGSNRWSFHVREGIFSECRRSASSSSTTQLSLFYK